MSSPTDQGAPRELRRPCGAVVGSGHHLPRHTRTPGVAAPEPSRHQGEAEAKARLEALQDRLGVQTRALTLPLPKA